MRNTTFGLLFFMMIFVLTAKAQAVFTVANKQYKAEQRTISYRYRFALKSKIFEISFVDSTVINKNVTLGIYQNKQYNKNNTVTVQETLLNQQGNDSIRRWYDNNTLSKYELLHYDSYHRLAKSVLTDNKQPKHSGESKYIHRDTITDYGKVHTMMAFKSYEKMLHGYDYQIKTYYDKQGDTLKQLYLDKKGETVVFNKYNNVRKESKKISYKEEVLIQKVDLTNKEQLLRKYLTVVNKKLYDPNYLSLDYEFYNKQKTIQLHIKKRTTNNLQEAIITVQALH